MNRRKLKLTALFMLCALWLSACHHAKKPEVLYGYVSTDEIFLSSPMGGKLAELTVKDGDSVKPDQLIFKLVKKIRE